MFMDLIKIELKGLPQRLFLSGLYDDIDGFRVVLKEKIKDKKSYILKFDGQIAYRNVNESERLKTLNDNKALCENHTFFYTRKSDFISWIIEESYDIVSEDEVTHYLLATPEDVVEIISLEEPTLEIID